MNSSLQCLAHAVPLMQAFLGGTYIKVCGAMQRRQLRSPAAFWGP